MTIIVFTLDERSFSRELAPLAGVYPALKLGPPWWFNDDTRAFCSIPARHDVARRVNCAYLATLVATGRLADDEAAKVAYNLTYRLAKQTYRLLYSLIWRQTYKTQACLSLNTIERSSQSH